MGTKSQAQIDAWLQGGGAALTSSERGARAVQADFNRARRAAGLTAWPAPVVRDWQSFARHEWQKRNTDARMVLNPLQEQSLWAAIIKDRHGELQLEGPRQRLAAMAMEAHRLLCTYTPKYLDPKARRTWLQDAAVFSDWLLAFEDMCRRHDCVSAARLPLELITILEAAPGTREQLLLAGFDRILPTQAALLHAWGSWQLAEPGESATDVSFFAATDAGEELAACALGCRRELMANPEARLLIVAQIEPGRRGEIERALLRFAQPENCPTSGRPLFEFSLGVPLAQTSLGRAALLTLQWLTGAIAENEIDWLLSTGLTAASPDEANALTAYMRDLRRRSLQRTEWKLTDWMTQRGADRLPAAWLRRMTQSMRNVDETKAQLHSPLEWSELTKQFLDSACWPGHRSLGSEEHQVTERLSELIEECASLGFSEERTNWRGYLSVLERAADQALFAPESQNASILIAGPAETAGLAVDAIWFLGASEDGWPAPGSTHPFLPIGVQREAGMPHAHLQQDWDLAQAVTARLLASASQVNFIYARINDDVDSRPSRLIAKFAGPAQPVPQQLRRPRALGAQTEKWIDSSTVAFHSGALRGGAAVLTAQSLCPFKAFATARLGAQSWDAAEASLTAKERGILLHEVLKSVWSGQPTGIASHAELFALADLRSFVELHARRAVDEHLPESAQHRVPAALIALELVRLTNLVTAWLEFERTRVPFSVESTELNRTVSIAGLDFNLRLDRLDRLNDGKVLVIDYKTSDVDAKAWEVPRPDDLQLPLYAGFALDPGNEEAGGLVFARIRAGDVKFVGRIENARASLLPQLHSSNGLLKHKLTTEQMNAWRDYIASMASDFIRGTATVTPKDREQTCKNCGLQALCRIAEDEDLTEEAESIAEEAEADD